jgi:hypothetical protein
MRKIKLLYTESAELLFSKSWPEVPEVQVSANKDAAMMANYERQIKHALRYAVPVLNKDKALEKIAFDGPLERDTIYEIECEYKVHSVGGYKIEIL